MILDLQVLIKNLFNRNFLNSLKTKEFNNLKV